MPLLQDNRSTKDEWFVADCAQRYISQENKDWNLRHVALTDWATNWISKGQDEFESHDDCDMVMLQELPRHNCAVSFNYDEAGVRLREQAELYRIEFEALRKRWQHDTKHLSLVSRKVAHPAFLRIVGIGEPVIPLLLESLRDRPAHWFAALHATANFDPVPLDANPSQAREIWLNWGRSKGYID